MKVENEFENGRLNKLNKELRSKIQDKEDEIKSVNNFYNQKIATEKDAGENAYLTTLDQNQKRLLSANADAEIKLKEYQNSLNTTKNNLEAQEKQLKEHFFEKEASLKNQSETKMLDTFNNTKEIEDQIKFNTDNEVKNINQKSHQQISELKQNTARDLNQYAVNYSNLSNNTENDFREKLNLDIQLHRQELINNKQEFQKNLDIETKKNQKLGNEKMRVQKDELETLDKFHQNLVDQKIADFKIRYNRLTEEHEQTLNELKQKLTSETDKLRNENLKTKTYIEEKFKDPFYKMEKIEPNISELGKSYFVSIKVPEHEKENVNLVAHGRTIKMTLSKRYNEVLPEDNGNVNRSSKSQLYSKELHVADLMNSKNIQAKYENGTLTYKIDKA